MRINILTTDKRDGGVFISYKLKIELNQKETYIDLNSLGKILHLEDQRSITKWCIERKLKIQVIGKKRLVYRFLVEIEIDKNLIEHLKENHPENWEELYQCYKDNDRLEFLDLLEKKSTVPLPSKIHLHKSTKKYAKAFSE